jgi:predicted XRE-type DNA-binding protein
LTPKQFAKAVIDLQAAGAIKAGHGWKSSLARALGVTRPTIDNYLAQGTIQKQTDLALSALLHGLEPLGQESPDNADG